MGLEKEKNKMEKIKKILQIPALCCASAIFVILLIALIIMSSQSYTHGTYVGEETIFGAKIKIEMNLKNNNNAVASITTVTGEDSEFEENEMKYKVADGVFFTSSDNGENYTSIGKIDAYKISVSESGYSMTLTNKGATTARTVLIVFMVIFGAAAVASATYTVINKIKRY